MPQHVDSLGDGLNPALSPSGACFILAKWKTLQPFLLACFLYCIWKFCIECIFERARPLTATVRSLDTVYSNFSARFTSSSYFHPIFSPHSLEIWSLPPLESLKVNVDVAFSKGTSAIACMPVIILDYSCMQNQAGPLSFSVCGRTNGG